MTRRLSIVVVAWFFPPSGGGGAQRPVHMASAFHGFGDAVTVLTPKAIQSFWAPDDDSLSRLTAPLDVRRFDGHGGRSGWEAFEDFHRFALEEIERIRPDVVLITMSPFYLAGIAKPIQRLGSRVVIDLRDPWALDAWPGYRSWWHWRREMGRMAEALRTADGFVMNTQDAMDAVLRRFPDVADRPREVVENGWAEADFPPPAPAARRGGVESPFRLVHSGTLHPGGSRSGHPLKRWFRDRMSYAPQRIDVSGRGPRHVIDAVRHLRDRNIDVTLDLIGAQSPGLLEFLEATGCDDFVRARGYLDHDLAVSSIRDADALFLPLGGLATGDRSLIVPGKTYEYLVAGPPVIGALPEGDARDLVGRSSRSFLCDPCDPTEIAEAIENAMRWWDRDPSARTTGIETFMERFERRRLARRMRDFLGSVAG